jgi:hypothetical protein
MNTRFDRYASDRLQAVRSAKHNAQFVIDHLANLRAVDRMGKMERAAKKFHATLESGNELTPAQYSYLDSIYEHVFQSLGLPSVGNHHDAVAKKLRYGR